MTLNGGAAAPGATLGLGLTGLNPTVPLLTCGALTFTGPITINGGLRVDSIGESGAIVNLLADTVFFGRPYFNADTAGFAVITAGTKDVRVAFDQPYEETPIVNVTLAVPATASMPAFAVSAADGTGFTVSLGANAVADTGFNWSALAVKTPHTFRSTPLPTPTPTPAPATPPPAVVASGSPAPILVTPTPTPEPVASASAPIATPTPTPTPTPIVAPTTTPSDIPPIP